MRQVIVLILLIALAACSPAPATEESRPVEPATEALPATSAPTATAMETSNLPALELLGGVAESCTNESDYEHLMGFPVRYYQLTTANGVQFRFLDENGNILMQDDTTGENKDGEEAWGFYPLAYSVPADSILTMTIEIYESLEENAPMTSISSISFNCTTGEVVDASFERTEG